MTTQLYDYEFRPWRIDGDRRIVADDAGWVLIRSFMSGLGSMGRTGRVRVPVDVFEDAGKVKMCNGDGRQLFISSHGGWSAEEAGNPWVLTCDVVFRLLALIDEYPNLTWLLETSHPENVAAMCNDFDHSGLMWSLPLNLWLYAKANTQADADSRIPHLLQVPAAVRGLVMTPRELIRFGGVPGFNKCGSAGQELLRRFHVIIRGGAEPMHPDNVRSIIWQCDAAGVPVWCESPVDGRTWNQLPEGRS